MSTSNLENACFAYENDLHTKNQIRFENNSHGDWLVREGLLEMLRVNTDGLVSAEPGLAIRGTHRIFEFLLDWLVEELSSSFARRFKVAISVHASEIEEPHLTDL